MLKDALLLRVGIYVPTLLIWVALIFFFRQVFGFPCVAPEERPLSARKMISCPAKSATFIPSIKVYCRVCKVLRKLNSSGGNSGLLWIGRRWEASVAGKNNANFGTYV